MAWQHEHQSKLPPARIVKAFNDFDTDKSGTIDAAELRRALTTMGFKVDIAAARDVLDRYERKGAKKGLTQPEFTTLVRDVVTHQEKETALKLATDDVVETAFVKFDTDRSGRIEGKEFSRALDAMGVPGDREHVAAAIAAYGEGNKSLDRAEFAKLARDLIAKQATESALAKLTPQAYRTAFDRFDTDRSGTIDADELQRALNVLMPETGGVKRTIAKEILAKYDVHWGAPALDLDEFTALVKDILEVQQAAPPSAPAAAIEDAFNRLDADHRGYVTTADLKPALDLMGLHVDLVGAQELMLKYDHMKDSRLNFAQFSMLVNDLIAEQQMQAAAERGETRRGKKLLSEHFYHHVAAGVTDPTEGDALRPPRARPRPRRRRRARRARRRAPPARDHDGPRARRRRPRRRRAQGAGAHVRRVLRARRGRDRVAAQGEPEGAGVGDREGVQRLRHRPLGQARAEGSCRVLEKLGVPGDREHVRDAIVKYGEGNKSLDLIEFAEMASDLIARQEAEAEMKAIREAAPQRLRETFDRFDADKSGTIEAKELQAALRAMGVTANLEQASHLMARYDEPAQHAAAAARGERSELATSRVQFVPQPMSETQWMRRRYEDVLEFELRHKTEQATWEVRKYMLDNDIMFNGAADPATKASQRGIAQAWNIAHLNAKERADNVTILDTIVRIMNSYPQIVVQIHGTTTAPKKAQDELTRYFERPDEIGVALDPRRDVRMIMDRLAHNRARAVCYALQERGVPSERMRVTSEGRRGRDEGRLHPRRGRHPQEGEEGASRSARSAASRSGSATATTPTCSRACSSPRPSRCASRARPTAGDPVRAELVEGEAHRFVVEPTRNDVVLLMQPLAGRVDAVVENDVPGRPLPPGLKYEVRHRKLQAVVCQGMLRRPATPRRRSPSRSTTPAPSSSASSTSSPSSARSAWPARAATAGAAAATDGTRATSAVLGGAAR